MSDISDLKCERPGLQCIGGDITRAFCKSSPETGERRRRPGCRYPSFSLLFYLQRQLFVTGDGEKKREKERKQVTGAVQSNRPLPFTTNNSKRLLPCTHVRTQGRR